MTADSNARFEVVHGSPSDEELAVVVSLMSAVAAATPATAAPQPQTSNWARPAMRWTPAPGPGAWVRSGLPQS